MCVALHEHGDIKIKLGLVGVGKRSPPCLLGNLQKTVHLMKDVFPLSSRQAAQFISFQFLWGCTDQRRARVCSSTVGFKNH